MKIWIELIFLESENELFQIDIDTNDKLKNIKNKLLYYPEEQTWFLDKKLNLEFNEWTDYDIYQVFIKENWMDIIIDANGIEYKLIMFKPSYTIYDIKLRIFEEVKIIPPNITLIFNGTILQNNLSLRNYKIKDNSVIKLIINLKSG